MTQQTTLLDPKILYAIHHHGYGLLDFDSCNEISDEWDILTLDEQQLWINTTEHLKQLTQPSPQTEISKVRARFTCKDGWVRISEDVTEEINNQSSYQQGSVTNIQLAPVTTNPPCEENLQFWNTNSSGSIWIAIANPKYSQYFQIGQDYYIDFTPVPSSVTDLATA